MVDFSVKLLNLIHKEIIEFAKYTLKYVAEVDSRSFDKEVKMIQDYYNINNYWIMADDQRIGVVKIFRNNYYSLGFEEKPIHKNLSLILAEIENQINIWNGSTIDATVNEKYINNLGAMGYEIQYSRNKMVLNLQDAKNLEKFKDITVEAFKNDSLKLLGEVFSDAFKDTFDEKTGFFNSQIAYSSLQSIFHGTYGEFKPELSAIVWDKTKKTVKGAALITISEDSPFIVIIGIRTEFQHSGLGRKLMSYLINKSLQQDYQKMRLWVTTQNTVARKLYESLGFNDVVRVYTLSKKV